MSTISARYINGREKEVPMNKDHLNNSNEKWAFYKPLTRNDSFIHSSNE